MSLFDFTNDDELQRFITYNKIFQSVTTCKIHYCVNLSYKVLDKLVKLLYNLTTIKFVNCVGLIRLPDSFKNLRKLKNLYISRCYNFKKMPASIRELHNLEEITINYCDALETLDGTIENCVNLKILNIYRCSKLRHIFRSVVNCLKLEHLDIAFCDALTNLTHKFSILQNLTTLSLDECNALPTFTDDISMLKNLTTLYIYNCKILSSTVLPSSICFCIKLQLISVNNINMLPPSMLYLPNLNKIRKVDYIRHDDNFEDDFDDLTFTYDINDIRTQWRDMINPGSGTSRDTVTNDDDDEMPDLLESMVPDPDVIYGCKNTIHLPESISNLFGLTTLEISDDDDGLPDLI